MGALGSDKAIGAIMKWSERDDWSERRATVFADHFGPVLDDFGMSIEEMIDLLNPESFMHLLGCILEDFMSCNFEPDERNVVDDYLKRRGWKESEPTKACLRALQRSVMSAYEVVDTAPGSHVLLRDLIRGGEPIRVEDKLASQELVQWDRIAARLLEIKGKIYMSAGVLPLTFEDAAEIAEAIRKVERKLLSKVKRALKEEGLNEIDVKSLPAADAVLGEMTPLFTRAWLRTVLEHLLNDALPEVRNLDGEPAQFCETRLPVLNRESLKQIEARLDAMAELTREPADRPEWTWLPASPPVAEHHAGSEHVSRSQGLAEEASHLLGWLHLEEDALVLETNSAGRAERGRAFLSAALGPLVGPPSTTNHTPAQVLAQGSTDRPEPQHAQLSLPLEARGEGSQHTLDRRYLATLNAPLPALDGKTPKQAARSKAGREKVARWLKCLENETARRSKADARPGYDFGWMWEALKIKDLRQ